MNTFKKGDRVEVVKLYFEDEINKITIGMRGSVNYHGKYPSILFDRPFVNHIPAGIPMHQDQLKLITDEQ